MNNQKIIISRVRTAIEKIQGGMIQVVEGIIEQGVALLELKNSCATVSGGSGFSALVESEFKLSRSVASAFCIIGQNSSKLFSNGEQLPTNYRSLAIIANFSVEAIQAGIASQHIHSDATQVEIAAYRDTLKPPKPPKADKTLPPLTPKMQEFCRQLEAGEVLIGKQGNESKVSNLFRERPELYQQYIDRKVGHEDAHSSLTYERKYGSIARNKTEILSSDEPTEEDLEKYLKTISDVLPKRLLKEMRPEKGQLPDFRYLTIIQNRRAMGKALVGLGKPDKREIFKRVADVLEYQATIFNQMVENRIAPALHDEREKIKAERLELKAEIARLVSGQLAIVVPKASISKIEMKKLLSAVHPDRAPEGFEKRYTECFNILKRVSA